MRTIEKLAADYLGGVITSADLLTYAVFAIPAQGVQHVIDGCPEEYKPDLQLWLVLFDRKDTYLLGGVESTFPEAACAAIEQWQGQRATRNG